MRTIITTLIALLTLTTSAMAEPPVRDDEPGWFKCDVTSKHPDIGGPDIKGVAEIRFDLWLPSDKDSRSAYIRNGNEYVSVDHRIERGQLFIDFPHYDSFIRAKRIKSATARKIYTGSWSRQRASGVAVMDFQAVAVNEVIAYPNEEDLKKKVGVFGEERWMIEFVKGGSAIGVFYLLDEAWSSNVYDKPKSERSADDPPRVIDNRAVLGTILTPTGDYRFLSGKFYKWRGLDTGYYTFSVFDGAHAFQFHIPVNAQDELGIGRFVSGNHWHETFTARRLKDGETYELPDPFSEVSLKPGVTRLGIPKLNEAPYAGKPTIVQIFGTWCPNCHDEAPVLVDLYERYHAEGLQILSLAYEYTPDLERSTKQINRFKERHGATWEFVAAGINDKKKTAATLPALSDIKSYPTTIWINPDGTVRAIHSGFSGPATGDAHTKTLEEFEHLTKQIIESQ